MSATHASGPRGATSANVRSDAEIIEDIPEPPITGAGAAEMPAGVTGDDPHTPASWTDVTLQHVYDARVRIATHLARTPMLSSRTLSDLARTTLGFKAELFQRTGSFKSRGAMNAALQLTPEQRERGVITISAGNHGQGLAYAASVVGTKAVIFMPKAAVPTKIDAIRGYGADIHFSESMDDVFERMDEYRIAHDLTFVSPFDDPAIIAGQGTVGLEMLEEMPDIDNVVIQAGGGGLLSGVSLAVKSLRPDVRVVGVEPVGANKIRKSLDAGRPLRTGPIVTVADGLAAPFAGNLTQAIISHYVDDVVLLEEEEIIYAMRLILERMNVLVEPSGAASLAAVLSGKAGIEPGSRTAVILTGGNVDREKLKSLL